MSCTEIEKWLLRHATLSDDYRISQRDDGSVDFYGSVVLDGTAPANRLLHLEQLPFEFATVSGLFKVENCFDLTSCYGFPKQCYELRLRNNSRLLQLGRVEQCTNVLLDCWYGETLAGAPACMTHLTVRDSITLRSLEGLGFTEKLVLDRCSQLDTFHGLQGVCSLDITSCSKLKDWPAVSATPSLHTLCWFHTPLKPPSAAMAIHLVKNNTYLMLSKKPKWLQVIKALQNPDDYLAAMADFERYFRVPYPLGAVDEAVPDTTFDL